MDDLQGKGLTSLLIVASRVIMWVLLHLFASIPLFIFTPILLTLNTFQARLLIGVPPFAPSASQGQPR